MLQVRIKFERKFSGKNPLLPLWHSLNFVVNSLKNRIAQFIWSRYFFSKSSLARARELYYVELEETTAKSSLTNNVNGAPLNSFMRFSTIA